MPRIADAALHDRILKVTYDLVKKKGVDAVTLRTVAKMAGTTTPTVYARFATKESLLAVLSEQLRQRFVTKLMSQPTLHKACEMYLQQIIDDPQDYKLLFEFNWLKQIMEDRNQPGHNWTCERLAELHGGTPKQYDFAADALWMELHGTASILGLAPSTAISKHLYKVCLRACDVMIANPHLFSANGVTKTSAPK